MSERINLKGSRKIQYSRSLLGGFKIWINNHGKTKFILEVWGFVAVIRGADPGNGCTISYTLCNCTAQEVKLVRVSYSNNKVGTVNSCILLNAVTGSISHNSHNIIQVGYILYYGRLPVNNSYIMTFFRKLLNQSKAYFTTANNYYIKTGGILFRLKHINLPIISINILIYELLRCKATPAILPTFAIR